MSFLRSYRCMFSPDLRASLTNLVQSRVASRVISGELVLSPISKDLNRALSTLREKASPSDIEGNIQAQRLRETRRLKEDLERKLQFVDEEISAISGQTKSKSALSRHKSTGLEEIPEELKRRKSTEFVRKLHLAQQASQRRRDLQASITARDLQKEAAEISIQREERERREAAEREERLKSMQERALRRKEYMDEVKNICKQTVFTPPAQSVTLPDLPVLPSIRTLKQHPSPEDLKAHFQLYAQSKRVHKERKNREFEEKRLSDRVHATINGRHYAEALEERRAEREKEEKRATERIFAREKQRRYAELVQEMYFPRVDPRKQGEVERRKLQGSVPRNAATRDKGTSRTSRDVASIQLEETQSAKPAVPRFPHGKPSPPVTPEPSRPRDYLAELRRASINQSHQALQSIQTSTQEWAADLRTFADSPTALQAKLTQLEATTKRHELALSHFPAADQEALTAEAGLNSLLVHSIRAKLALLHQN